MSFHGVGGAAQGPAAGGQARQISDARSLGGRGGPGSAPSPLLGSGQALPGGKVGAECANSPDSSEDAGNIDLYGKTSNFKALATRSKNLKH